MAKKQARTLIEVAVARAGLMRGSRVTKFVTEWTLVVQAVGHPITLAEFAEWWSEPMSTAYRRQAQFREVFPELETPQPIADLVIAGKAKKAAGAGVEGIGKLPAAAVLS